MKCENLNKMWSNHKCACILRKLISVQTNLCVSVCLMSLCVCGISVIWLLCQIRQKIEYKNFSLQRLCETSLRSDWGGNIHHTSKQNNNKMNHKKKQKKSHTRIWRYRCRCVALTRREKEEQNKTINKK